MTSLALQLKEYNKSQKKQISREVVDAMTQEELASEKITFGESKKGMTYAQAFEDAQWTEFILNRFECHFGYVLESAWLEVEYEIQCKLGEHYG